MAWNNYALTPTKSKNYDINITIAENTVGLFTIGGYYKRIDDLIYSFSFSKTGLAAAPWYLPSRTPSRRQTYNISTFVNNPFEAEIWGFEFEWQTHFWYLPDPLKGLVLSVNYTNVNSESKYPVSVAATVVGEEDELTYFVDRLLYQPDDIFNITMGYDYKDFSIRVTFQNQDDVFSAVSVYRVERASTDSYKRWDISVKQKLPWYGLQIYGNLNNLNNAQDRSNMQLYKNIPTSIEVYGMTAELGMRWQL